MRRFWVILTCTVGLFGLIATTIATTATLTILNRAQVLHAADATLTSRRQQEQLTNNISIAVLKNMPAAGRTEAATAAIRNSANASVKDPAFKPIWTSAVDAAYTQVIEGRTGDTTLNPELLTALVRNHLAEQSPQVVALLPASTQLSVPLTTQALPDLRAQANIVRLATVIGAGVAVLGYGIGLAVSRRRRRTLRGAGWWMLASGVVLLALAFTAPTLLLPLVRSGSSDIGSAIAGMGWRVWVPAAALTTLGLTVAILGVVLARRAPENRITRTIVPEPEVVAGQPPVDVWDCRV